MAKSTGNLVFVDDVLQDATPAALRLLICQRRWWDSWEFDPADLPAAEARVIALRHAAARTQLPGAATTTGRVTVAIALADDLRVRPGARAPRTPADRPLSFSSRPRVAPPRAGEPFAVLPTRRQPAGPRQGVQEPGRHGGERSLAVHGTTMLRLIAGRGRTPACSPGPAAAAVGCRSRCDAAHAPAPASDHTRPHQPRRRAVSTDDLHHPHRVAAATPSSAPGDVEVCRGVTSIVMPAERPERLNRPRRGPGRTDAQHQALPIGTPELDGPGHRTRAPLAPLDPPTSSSAARCRPWRPGLRGPAGSAR